ncbi:hypothetical protein HHK36_013361 [Tetracentron sinense]|uniref:Formin-like protein n=1 Tax=Tetracentron sinense TaxID=13715 RepID=A0A835DGI0_TETSI|nr:hypothetical protein HHK36_013361 [Tetracentron sinense]
MPTFFILLLLLSYAPPHFITCTPIDSHHHRRILHQPFFPLDSFPPTQPPSSSPQPHKQPKFPFSTSTNKPPFFPSYPSPPSPPSDPSSLATFPANISSLMLPQTPSRKPVSPKLVAIAVILSLLSLSLIAAFAVLLYQRRRRNFAVTKTSRSDSNGRHKVRGVSTTSSEFLYLGTLVNSRGIDGDADSSNAGAGAGAGASGVVAAASPYRKLGSPELQPLPPLPRQNFSQNFENAEVGSSEEEVFYSPRGSSGHKEESQSPAGTRSSSQRVFATVAVDKFGSRSSDSGTPSYPSSNLASPIRSISNSPSPTILMLSLKAKSSDFVANLTPPPPPPPPPRPSPPKRKPPSPSPPCSAPMRDFEINSHSPSRVSDKNPHSPSRVSDKNPHSPSRVSDVSEKNPPSPSRVSDALEKNPQTPSRVSDASEINLHSPSRVSDVSEKNPQTPSRVSDASEKNLHSPSRISDASELHSPSRVSDVSENNPHSPSRVSVVSENNPHSPSRVLDALEKNPHSPARVSDVSEKNRHSPSRVSDALEKNPHSPSRVSDVSEKNPHSPSRVLDALEKNPHSPSRVSEKNPHSPSRVLDALEKNPHSPARVSDVSEKNPHSAPRVSDASEKNPHSPSRVSEKNPHSPSRVSDDLAKNSHSPLRVLDVLEKNPHSPSRILDVSGEIPLCPGRIGSESSQPVSIPPPPPPLPPPPPPPRFWEAPIPPTSIRQPISRPPILITPSRPVVFQNPTTVSPSELPGNSDPLEKNEETPKLKLKPLHWDKVRASSDRAMVWDQLKSSSFQLNEEMIETLFVVNASNLTPKETTWRSVLPSPNQEYRVLDPKKSQNIAILLRALNVTIDEVCEALLEGNADTLGAELLESLLRMAPSKEEECKLKDYKDDSPFKLGPAERFLKAVLDIPFAFKRVDVMLYIANFDSEVEYLRKSFETLEVACEELRNNRMFMKLLEAVLKTGNRMNVGTNRGDAHAFKLDTLLKLVDVKGTDGKTTLLHFVVQEITRTEGSRLSGSNQTPSAEKTQQSTFRDEVEFRKLGLQVVAGLSGELTNVKKAAAMDSDVLCSDVSKLARGIGNIGEVVTLNEATGLKESSQRFSDSMNRFLKKAEEEIISIQAQESVALSLVKEITEYFHGNSAKEEAHPFRIFTVVRDFLSILDQVCKEVGKINERTIVSSARQFPVPVNPTLPPVFPRFHGRPQSSSSDDEGSSSP